MRKGENELSVPSANETKRTNRSAAACKKTRRAGQHRRRHPYRDRALRALAEYPYRKNAVSTAGRWNRELERARRFVDCVESALAMLTPEEREVLLDKSDPLPDGSLPTGFDRYERAACEKSTYYRLRAKALEKFSLALYGAK